MATWLDTEPAPALSPKMMIFDGSPLKATMFLWTQRRAIR